MTTQSNGYNLPKLSRPAQRALNQAGYFQLEDLTKITKKELLQLHGIGPKSIEPLRRAMAEHGLTFLEKDS